jgi:hypothetical protein
MMKKIKYIFTRRKKQKQYIRIVNTLIEMCKNVDLNTNRPEHLLDKINFLMAFNNKHFGFLFCKGVDKAFIELNKEFDILIESKRIAIIRKYIDNIIDVIGNCKIKDIRMTCYNKFIVNSEETMGNGKKRKTIEFMTNDQIVRMAIALNK